MSNKVFVGSKAKLAIDGIPVAFAPAQTLVEIPIETLRLCYVLSQLGVRSAAKYAHQLWIPYTYKVTSVNGITVPGDE